MQLSTRIRRAPPAASRLSATCSHALVFGTLLGMTYPPEEGSQRVLVATLYDGTDTLELRWPGRTSIPGLSVGQRLEVEGTVGRTGDRLVIINPLYRVIAGEG